MADCVLDAFEHEELAGLRQWAGDHAVTNRQRMASIAGVNFVYHRK
jgi:hypothetical protein